MAQEPTPPFPERLLPARIERLFRHAIESQELRPQNFDPRSNPRDINRESLRKLQAARWPDTRMLQRVQITFDQKPPVIRFGWLVKEAAAEVTILHDDFAWQTVPKIEIADLKEIDYLDQLRHMLARHEQVPRHESAAHPRDSAEGWWIMPARLGNAVLAVHAYSASLRGHEMEAEQLIAAALIRDSKTFETIHKQWSWSSFLRGIELLENGASRKEVTEHWRQTLARFPECPYSEQLQDYLRQLALQVIEDESLATSAVDDPKMLPLAERIEYYVARLPDVQGGQMAQPGHCITYGMGDWTKISDALIEIGLPAAPALIDCMDDRRLTRSIGFWRDFARSRTVLRVQDVAIQALEQILTLEEGHIYSPPGTAEYFSIQPPEVRDALTAQVKSWWRQNSYKSLRGLHRAWIESRKSEAMIETLERFASEERDGLSKLATIRKWGESGHVENKLWIAHALARHSDLSLFPQISARALDRSKQPWEGGIGFVMRHGDAQHYRILRQMLREERSQVNSIFETSSTFSIIAWSVSASDRPLAAPLQVDLLNETDEGLELADRCMASLIKLTKHDAGYLSDAPDVDRRAAMEHWRMWWNDQGRAAFLASHPEVKEVY